MADKLGINQRSESRYTGAIVDLALGGLMTTRDAAFGIVLPIGSLGSSQISIDLGAGIQVPISGSGENDSGVTGEFGLDVRETIGLRVTLPEFWRDE